jgi:hypothetical protein
MICDIGARSNRERSPARLPVERRGPVRKLLILLALTAMTVLAGACDPPEDESSPAKRNPSENGTPAEAGGPTSVETVQVAYRETAAEGTARISYEATTTGPTVDPGNSAGASSGVMTVKGGGVTDFSGAASSMTVGMPGMGDLEMRQVGETVYVRMPNEFAAQTSGSKPWVRVDLDALYGQQYGGAPVQGGASGDPTRQLEYLRGVSESVEKIGEGRVRGVPTIRYEAVVDLSKGVAGQDADVKQTNQELVKGLGTSKLPVEVWIDGENRVRRYALDVSVPMPDGAASQDASQGDDRLRTRMVIEYYDFGTPVDVQAPPQDQTVDGSKLLAEGQPATR